ncbi:MAG TPA: hypothetical protein ENO30_05600 [Thermodesulfobium narugense]|nr:hypothetical protein [Thermodesulfobium narugense]
MKGNLEKYSKLRKSAIELLEFYLFTDPRSKLLYLLKKYSDKDILIKKLYLEIRKELNDIFIANQMIAYDIFNRYLRKYNLYHIQEDLKQECLKALWEGIQAYEPEKSHNFSTYIYNWIQAYVNEFLKKEFKHAHLSLDENISNDGDTFVDIINKNYELSYNRLS